MFSSTNQTIHLFLLLGGLLMPGIQHVSGIVTFTASEVEVVNGTDMKLKCIFSSSYPVSPQSVSVFWFFQPLRSGPEESAFYYQGRPYPPTGGRFRRRVIWSGDVMKNDASITLKQVSPDLSGTYSCKVKNIPDVHGIDGEVVLRVVNESTSFDPTAWLLALSEFLPDPFTNDGAEEGQVIQISQTTDAYKQLPYPQPQHRAVTTAVSTTSTANMLNPSDPHKFIWIFFLYLFYYCINIVH